MSEDAPQIIGLINKISKEAGALEKTRSEAGGIPFPFRGVDSTINHLAPILNDNGVVVIPRILDNKVSTRELANNKALTTSDLVVQFTYYAPDGSNLVSASAGLAQDYADRSAAQAQSVAFRVNLLQVFHLPTQQPEPEVAGAAAQAVAEAEGPKKPDPIAKAEESGKETVDSLRARVLAVINNPDSPYDSEAINALGDKVSGKERAVWFKSTVELKKLLAAVEAGETA